jgi:hypothetical protein
LADARAPSSHHRHRDREQPAARIRDSLGEDGSYRIEVLRHLRPEILTLRRTVSGGAPDLPWPAETVDAFLAPAASIVLLIGTDGGSTRRAFESLVSHVIPTGPGPVLGLARLWPPNLSTGRAAVTLLSRGRREEVDRASQLVDPMEPELFILDTVDDPLCLRAALGAMQCGSRVILCVATRSPALAMHRLLAPLDETESRNMLQYLSWSLTGVLLASSDEESGTIAIDDATRAALGRGDREAWVNAFPTTPTEPQTSA